VKLAFISDIHANFYAFESAFRHAMEHGADRIYCAGDFLGYGPHPNEVLQFGFDNKIPSITGNYDRKILEISANPDLLKGHMKPFKWQILSWTASRITAAGRRFLQMLPETLLIENVGGYRILMVHGSPVSMDDTIYPSITTRAIEWKTAGISCDVLVCGHTHIPFVKHLKQTLVVNCGSAGQPVDGDPRGAYAVVTIDRQGRPRGRIVRFGYPVERTIDDIEKTDLPKRLAGDLQKGLKKRENP
jgi:putative phosphoesterase